MAATANPVLDRALAHLGRYGYRGGAPRSAEVDPGIPPRTGRA